jgi:hypothetical protein
MDSEKKYDCICLDIAGQLNFTREGVPIEDCEVCSGTGIIPKGVNNE